MLQVFKKPQVCVYPVLALGLWAFFAFAMPDVLEFWEKNQLFRFSSDYWHFFDHESFGTLIYLHTFLIQFNYYTWLGAIVYALLFTLTAFLFNRCVETNGNRRLLPGLLSVALLLPTTANFGLLVLMVAFFSVLGAHLWIYWKNRCLRYACQVVVLTALTYLVREYMVWVLPFYMCLDWGHTRRQEQKFNFFFWLIPLAGTALAWILETWYCAPYDFVYRNHAFLFLGRFFAPSGCIPYGYFKPSIAILVCMGIFAFISWFWIFYVLKKQVFTWILGPLFIIGGIWFTHKQAQAVSNFQKVDTLCRAYRWEEALQILNTQWDKNPQASSMNSFAERLFCFQTKLTLLSTRKATSYLFTYPTPDFPLLFPIDATNKPESFLLPTYYTFTGGFSESLHLNYDLITSHCISANVLTSTIISSLILGDTLPAFKLTHLLEQSLFYQAQAAIYKNDSLYNTLAIIKRGKQMLPSQNYSTAAYAPDLNGVRQHYYQPDNPYAYEYTLCVVLLGKMHKVLKGEMPNIKKFYNKPGEFIAPRHIQEALLAAFDYNSSRYLYPTRIEGVSQEIWNDYWLFIADNMSYLNGNISFSDLRNKWDHTYWFFDCYLKNINTTEGSQTSD